MDITLSPCTGLNGVISMNGDKSISHRALMLGAISRGVTNITNLSTSEDVHSTENCIRDLGVKVTKREGITSVHGVGLHGFIKPDVMLNAGNSGTTMRLMSGLLIGQNFDSVITGDESLCKRPMGRIIEPLKRMGASILATNNNYAPLRIHGAPVFPMFYTLPMASAQVKSCILLAALYAEGLTRIKEPLSSRNHTELMLADFGIKLERRSHLISIQGGQQPIAFAITIPGDVSSASFFIAAATLVPNSTVTIKDVGLNQTRIGFIRVLQRMGAQIDINPAITNQKELLGDVTVRSSELRSTTITAENIPSMIDELPVFAVVASQAKGITTVKGAGELRVKESDRLRAITENLRQMGIEINELEDGFIIHGPQLLKGAHIDSFNDHRMAMAFSIAALIAQDVTTIHNAECVSISMPEFFQIIDSLISKDQ